MASWRYNSRAVWRLIRLDDHWLWGIIDLNDDTIHGGVQALIPRRYNPRAKALFEQRFAQIALVVGARPEDVREPRRFGTVHRLAGWTPTHAAPKRDWPRPVYDRLMWWSMVEAEDAARQTTWAIQEQALMDQFLKMVMIPAERW